MTLLDTIQNAALKVLPEKKPTLPLQASHTGIGSGGMVPFEDDVSSPIHSFARWRCPSSPRLPYLHHIRRGRASTSYY